MIFEFFDTEFDQKFANNTKTSIYPVVPVFFDNFYSRTDAPKDMLVCVFIYVAYSFVFRVLPFLCPFTWVSIPVSLPFYLLYSTLETTEYDIPFIFFASVANTFSDTYSK